MIRKTTCLLPALVLVGASGCAPSLTPAEIAAAACDVQVQTQLGADPYRLDLDALAASKIEDGRGSHLLTAPVVVSAGLAGENTQQLECTVRMAPDQASAEVLIVRFIW